MTIKEYEDQLSKNNIKVNAFGVTQSYYIKTELGTIHIDTLGNITSITGDDKTRQKLCKLFNYPTQRAKKRWEYKIDYLSSRINYLEKLLKTNNINYEEEK